MISKIIFNAKVISDTVKGIKLDNTIDNPEILLTAAWLGIKKKNTAAAMMATASVKIINSFNSSCFFIIIIESFFRILQSNHYITEHIDISDFCSLSLYKFWIFNGVLFNGFLKVKCMRIVSFCVL